MISSSVESRLNDRVTHHMRTDIPTLGEHQSVAEALNHLRTQTLSGRVIYFYVVDQDRRLLGVIPTRRLLLNDPASRVADLMIRDIVVIPHTATVIDACEFFVFHRLLAFPVVDDERRMLGVVDVELYTSELSDLDRKVEGDQLFQLIGVHLTDAQQASPLVAFKTRFPWLLANIIGGILAAFLAGVFEADLQKTVALALFIPVVLALAESVSIQSVSIALQLLRGKTPTVAELQKKLRAELATGLALGAACGITIAVVALVWLRQVAVAGCLAGGILGGVTVAAVVGVAIPNFLRLFQRDPQVAAGPIALAVTDILTLLTYFTLARWWLS